MTLLKFFITILFMVSFSIAHAGGSVSYQNSSTQENIHYIDNSTVGVNQINSLSYRTFDISIQGQVNVAARQSYSISPGVTSSVIMKGIGSAHSFTAIGELYPTTYNELGGFEGELTNMGSINGTMSGTELLLRDSPDNGKSSTPTKMQPVVSRIAQYNNGTTADSFYASTEGSQPPHSILTGNNGGSWVTGIDFSHNKFTSGYAAIFPNNYALGWVNVQGATVPVFSYNQTGVVFFTDNTARFVINRGNGVFDSILEYDKDGISINVNGVMKRVSVNATSRCLQVAP